MTVLVERIETRRSGEHAGLVSRREMNLSGNPGHNWLLQLFSQENTMEVTIVRTEYTLTYRRLPS